MTVCGKKGSLRAKKDSERTFVRKRMADTTIKRETSKMDHGKR